MDWLTTQLYIHNFFRKKVEKYFLADTLGSVSMEMFKGKFDGAMSNLVWWKVSMAGDVELDDLYGPLQLKLFYDSVILRASNIIAASEPDLINSTG